MPRKQISYQNNSIYHIMNRGVGGIQLFRRHNNYKIFLNTYNYYQKKDPQIPKSKVSRLPQDDKVSILTHHFQKEDLVDIYAYCLMPNHFHFLVKQKIENGVSVWMRKASNSYSSFFNKKYNRKGYLFQSSFKAVEILTDEQFMHCIRYIHLNPFMANLVESNELSNYKWSSFPHYVSNQQSIIKLETEFSMSFYKGVSDFKQFTLDHADYAKSYHKNGKIFLD